MSFKFVHTADWQIGKPFGRLPSNVATTLQKARFDVIPRLAELARGEGARHVLVAGDVFDSETPPDALLERLMASLDIQAHVTWHLLPGNHDPARAGGVWERLRGKTPGNVRMHLTPEPVRIEAGVDLLPAPLTAKATSSDPTEWMDRSKAPDGVIRVGMAHGSVQGFGSLGEAAVPIDPRRVASARLDYLALGDWHGAKQVGPGAWYSGTPEPDSFADNGQGQSLVVGLPGPGQPAIVKTVRTGSIQWIGRRIVLTRCDDVQPLVSEVEKLGADVGHCLMELRLEGTLPAADEPRLAERITWLEARLMYLRADRSRLRVGADAGDLDVLETGAMRSIGERLAHAAASDGEGAEIAARALSLLFSFGTNANRQEDSR